jgi:hypothetical protein
MAELLHCRRPITLSLESPVTISTARKFPLDQAVVKFGFINAAYKILVVLQE